MYLRSIVTFDCKIWLVGLPASMGEKLRALPVAKGLSLEFLSYGELPAPADRKPECIIFALAPGLAAKARKRCAEDTMLVAWRDAERPEDEQELSLVDELWDAPSEAMLPHRFAWLQEHLWRRYHAWLCHNFWQTTINMVPDLMWYKDLDGLHLEVNNGLAKTVGRTRDDCRGQRHGYIWGLSPEEYEKGEYACRESDQQVINSGQLMIGGEQVLENGELRDLKTFKTPLFDKDGKIFGTAGVAQDITLLNRYHKQILDMAHRDELTGLSNRRFFYEYVSEYRKNQAVCIFSIDLDHFKEVNDTYGHKVGDDALKAVSGVLAASFPNAVVCRFGGDEFVVLLLGSLTPRIVHEMAEEFLGNLRLRFGTQEKFRILTASVGIAVSRDMNCPIDELIKRSDAALYEAKESGRNCVRMYHDPDEDDEKK